MMKRYKPLKRTPIKRTPWDKAKNEQEKKKAKAGLSKPALIKKLDRWFSLYIRLRDVNDEGVFQCPTCRRILPFSKGDASHYWGRIHMATRFDPDNVTIECQYDNRFNSSHLIYLGKYLEKKLGSKKMELLEWKHRQAKNWSLFELQELIEFYKKEVERLKKEKHYGEWAKSL